VSLKANELDGEAMTLLESEKQLMMTQSQDQHTLDEMVLSEVAGGMGMEEWQQQQMTRRQGSGNGIAVSGGNFGACAQDFVHYSCPSSTYIHQQECCKEKKECHQTAGIMVIGGNLGADVSGDDGVATLHGVNAFADADAGEYEAEKTREYQSIMSESGLPALVSAAPEAADEVEGDMEGAWSEDEILLPWVCLCVLLRAWLHFEKVVMRYSAYCGRQKSKID